MVTIPLGAEVNLGIQTVSLAIILVGLRFAVLTHRAFAKGSDDGAKLEAKHKNLMTSAVVVSGLGAIVWMIPNYFLGWFYGTTGLGYGSGGYQSYYVFAGVYLDHWYLMVLMAGLGSITAILGVYLVLRMRWSRFPEALKVQNYRAVMITTWSLWFVNILVGFLVFYFFAFLQTG
ncbi:MAG TPA: hypothetical protein VK126_03015 [Nitrososphaerales archaeon]|nr:hypothetical protein [Nitrososphaerales archaeon]